MKYVLQGICAFLALFFSGDAQAFNIVMVYDPFFREWILFQVPFVLAGAMLVASCVLVYPKVRAEVSFVRFVIQHAIGHLLAIYFNILILMVIGALLFGALNEGEPVVVWIALVYFYALFTYVGWWIAEMSLAKSLNRHKEKGAAKPYRLRVLLPVIVFYFATYYYVISELRF